MATGERFHAERRTFADDVPEVQIRQVTNDKGRSTHFFTNSSWYDGGRKLLAGAERGNRTNLFSVDLEGGVITQVTHCHDGPWQS